LEPYERLAFGSRKTPTRNDSAFQCAGTPDDATIPKKNLPCINDSIRRHSPEASQRAAFHRSSRCFHRHNHGRCIATTNQSGCGSSVSGTGRKQIDLNGGT
jgi:hypothetical protein